MLHLEEICESVTENLWELSVVYFSSFPCSCSPACISKYSAGSVFYYPSFHYIHNPAQLEKFQKDLERYLTRKIGFEAVMRIRCTKGNWVRVHSLCPSRHLPTGFPFCIWGCFLHLFYIKFSNIFFVPVALRFIHPHVPRQLLCALHRPAVPGQCEPRLCLCCPDVDRRLSGRLISGLLSGCSALHLQ